MIIPEQLKAIKPAFKGLTRIEATYNQRYLDHDSESAKKHTQEIKEIGIEELKIENYVKNNEKSISFGGAIFVREISRNVFACPDGMSRKNKINQIILCIRNSAEDKSKFDSYLFNDENDIRITYLDEHATYVDSNYIQVNKIIEYLTSDTHDIQDVLSNFNEKRYSQRYYFLSQLGQYYNWISTISFENDDERINFIENILDLHKVIWVNSLNDVKSFIHNSQETRRDSNGIDLIANTIMDKVESKYFFTDDERLEIEQTIKQTISYGFSPSREHDEPLESKIKTEWVTPIQLSYETNSRGRKKSNSKVLNVISDEITDDIISEIHGDYKEYQKDDSNFRIIKTKIENSIKNNRYIKDILRLHNHKMDSILGILGTNIWYPIILKWENVIGRGINEDEKIFISFLQLCNKIIPDGELWNGWQYWRHEVLNDIDSIKNKKITLNTVLMRNLIFPTTQNERANFGSKTFSQIMAESFTSQRKSNWGKETDGDYKFISQFDKLLGHLSLKGNIKNWKSIQKGFRYTDTLIKELEHFLSRKGQTKSDVIKTILNLWFIEKSDNLKLSNKPINEKIKLLKTTSASSLSFLFYPPDNLENDIKDLLTSDEFKSEFSKDDFNDDDWIRICLVGLNESIQLPNNLIYKYRKLQIDNLLKKINE